MPMTRSTGTSPSYGHPNDTEITPSQRRPSSRARATVRSIPCSDSSTERFTFFWLWVSLAERNRLTSEKRSRCSSARSSPLSLGISTETATSSGMSAAASTSPPSASWGITSARTKLVTSRRRSPVRASISTSRTFSGVGMISGSFWKPSRGPTSRTLTCIHRLHHAEAAAHPERLAGDERGVVGGEEDDRGGTSSGSPGRPMAVAATMPCGEARAEVVALAQPLEHRRADRPRRHGVAGDPVARRTRARRSW